MPYCNCGRQIDHNGLCDQCARDEHWGDRADALLEDEASDDADDEWGVDQQGLGDRDPEGQATLDGGVSKEGSR